VKSPIDVDCTGSELTLAAGKIKTNRITRIAAIIVAEMPTIIQTFFTEVPARCLLVSYGQFRA
jgi:hypothetical protein